MDKKNVMLYGVISSGLLLISAIVPYFKVTITNDDGNVISSYGLNFLGTYLSLIHFVLIIVMVLLAIRNYKIVKNNLEKNISNPFWVTIIWVFVATGIIAMMFAEGMIDYYVNEGGDWPSFAKAIGYYLFRGALISELLYVILIFISCYKENTLKNNFKNFFKIFKWFVIVLIIFLILKI